MNKEREEILKQIYATPTEDIVKEVGKSKPKKRSKLGVVKEIVKELFIGPFRFIGAFLGVTEENIGSSTGTRSHSINDSNNSEEYSHLEENTFKETVSFDPAEVYKKRIQQEENLKSIGYTRDDIVLTGEEYFRRKQEDAYFDSLPGYRKEDNEHDER